VTWPCDIASLDVSVGSCSASEVKRGHQPGAEFLCLVKCHICVLALRILVKVEFAQLSKCTFDMGLHVNVTKFSSEPCHICCMSLLFTQSPLFAYATLFSQSFCATVDFHVKPTA